MMLNSNPSPWRRSRVLYVIPVAALALSAFATPEFKNASDLIEETVQIEDKVTESSADLQAEDEKFVAKNTITLKIDADGALSYSINGSDPKNITPVQLMDALREHRDEPTLLDIECYKDMPEMENLAKSANRENGMLRINCRMHPNQGQNEEKPMVEGLPVDMLCIVDGKEVSHETFMQMRPEDIKAMTVLKAEAAVAKYGEKGRNGVCVVETKHSSHLDQPEVLPKFGDSDAAIWEFLMRNLRYPKLAQECGATGRVMVGFVVETDGSVSEVKIVNSPSKPDDVRKVEGEAADAIVTAYKAKEGDEQYLSEAEWNSSLKALEEEAMRVVSLTSGQWTPATNKGEKVRTSFTLPITFCLN